ncbi:hypothetical protein KI387_037122, partial [Taxus chinensis]
EQLKNTMETKRSKKAWSISLDACTEELLIEFPDDNIHTIPSKDGYPVLLTTTNNMFETQVGEALLKTVGEVMQ